MDGLVENLTHCETFAVAPNEDSIFELFPRSALNNNNNAYFELDAKFHSECRNDFEKSIIIVNRVNLGFEVRNG